MQVQNVYGEGIVNIGYHKADCFRVPIFKGLTTETQIECSLGVQEHGIFFFLNQSTVQEPLKNDAMLIHMNPNKQFGQSGQFKFCCAV